jgi:hypothetical protein
MSDAGLLVGINFLGLLQSLASIKSSAQGCKIMPGIFSRDSINS